MCSIAGYLSFVRPMLDVGRLGAMNRALAHRGPDGSGMFVAAGGAGGATAFVGEGGGGQAFEHAVGLGHNRFSIVDLSPAGQQPFVSACGRWAVTFNGEIYNHRQLRPELETAGWRFRSRCDTEVLLAGFAIWGEECFRRLNGFWAAAFWDNQRGSLLLTRDRFGEAPLFYTRREGVLYFASEIPALIAPLGMRPVIGLQAVSNYLHHGLTDLGGETFFEGIHHFPPASVATVRSDGTLDVRQYWRPPERRLTERQLPAEEAVVRCRELLTTATSLRLQADVPVGFQLSGGMDSSALVAFAAGTGHRLSAYTVSYPGTKHDEFPFAKAVAEHYPGLVDHQEVRDPGAEFWPNADEIVGRYAEPFAGPNHYTQQMIWQSMRQRGIKVVVNGGAGDELLAGYRRDFHSAFLRGLMLGGRLGRAWGEAAALSEEPLPMMSAGVIRRLLAALGGGGTGGAEGQVAFSSPGSAVHYLPKELVPLASMPAPWTDTARSFDERIAHCMSDWRLSAYCKAGNITSLAVPVEVRLPFLDHQVADFAFALPRTYLIRDGWMKWILRKAAEPLLPAGVVWRKRKMGFPFRYGQWCRESRPAFEELVAGSTNPYIDHRHLLTVWEALAERNPIFLWRCMSLSLWWRKCVEGKSLSGLAGRRSAA